MRNGAQFALAEKSEKDWLPDSLFGTATNADMSGKKEGREDA